MAFEGTINQIERMSPSAQKEREWQEFTRNKETQLFDARLKKLSAEAVAKERENEILEQYDRIRGITDSVETYMVSAQGKSPEDRKELLKSQTSGSPEGAEILKSVQGNYPQLLQQQEAMEEQMVRMGVLKSAPEREWAVDINGNYVKVAKNSKIRHRGFSKHEEWALKEGFDPLSPEFEKAADLHSQGKFEQMDFITPNGPMKMERWKGETLGLSTKEQVEWEKSQPENEMVEVITPNGLTMMSRKQAGQLGFKTKSAHEWQVAEDEKMKSLDDEKKAKRTSLNQLSSKAQSFRRETESALGAVSRARSLLQNSDGAADGSTGLSGPRALGENFYDVAGKRSDMELLRDELRQTLTQIQSNVALGKLGELKSQSKTGATGFGALSESELALLTGALGSLDAEKGTDAGLLASLETIDRLLTKATRGFIPGETSVVGDLNPWNANSGSTAIYLGGDPDDADNWEILP